MCAAQRVLPVENILAEVLVNGQPKCFDPHDGFVCPLVPKTEYDAIFHLPLACGVFKKIKKEDEPIRIEKLNPVDGKLRLSVYCRDKTNALECHGLDHCQSHIWVWAIDLGGYFRSTKMGFVSQHELCFLVYKPGPVARCVRRDKGIFVEGFEKFEALHEFMSMELGLAINMFPWPEVRKPELDMIPVLADDNDGVVDWFDPWQGFGVATFGDGHAFVHWAEIKDWPAHRGRLISLKAGDLIQCDDFATEAERKLPQALGVRLR